MATQLVPCPFCGGSAGLVDLTEYQGPCYVVRCRSCGCKTPAMLEKRLVRSIWNKRVTKKEDK